jgi:hypothetical protein
MAKALSNAPKPAKHSRIHPTDNTSGLPISITNEKSEVQAWWLLFFFVLIMINVMNEITTNPKIGKREVYSGMLVSRSITM